MTKERILIAAVSKNWVIGVDNKIPWNLPEDLKHFKNETSGGIIVMGKKTYDSIGGKLLPNRLNIILSKSMSSWSRSPFISNSLQTSHGIIVKDFESINMMEDMKLLTNWNRLYYIGGGSIYEYALENDNSKIDKMIITHVDIEVKTYHSVYFPHDSIFWNHWKVQDSTPISGNLNANIVTYIKK